MITRMNTAMATSQERRRNGEKGFTLIELLVVIVIIGILAAIAIPVFLSQREGAWKSSVATDLTNAALSIETYAQNHNGSLTGLTDATFTTSTAESATSPGVTVTDGNTIKVDYDGNAYVITGFNKNIAPTGTQQYDSKTGGLKPWSPTGTQ